ncbi:MAG TPA: hypothetical protein VE134_03565 [Methanomicrobiales archaeon]|nr:hypothetical protein [Methanomicrobiales archaeon]
MIKMPERVVETLTGSLPEPILKIPKETWDAFSLTGGPEEYIDVDFVAGYDRKNEKLYQIDRTIRAKTEERSTRLGGKVDGIVVPKELVQEYGIRSNHFIEVVLEKVVKGEKETNIFPNREVFEQHPSGFSKSTKK